MGRSLTDTLTRAERFSAPVCALVLLAHPTPLSAPAAFLGSLPLVARWVTAGRPWRASPFDLPLALLAVGTILGFIVAVAPGGAAVRLCGVLAALRCSPGYVSISSRRARRGLGP